MENSSANESYSQCAGSLAKSIKILRYSGMKIMTYRVHHLLANHKIKRGIRIHHTAK